MTKARATHLATQSTQYSPIYPNSGFCVRGPSMLKTPLTSGFSVLSVPEAYISSLSANLILHHEEHEGHEERNPEGGRRDGLGPV